MVGFEQNNNLFRFIMVQAQLPFRFQEVFKLTNLGLSPDLFKFGNLSFESQKYICVKDGAQCVIIDTSQNFKVERKDMKADAILMHKEKNIIAVRAKPGANSVIQVYDMVRGPPALKQCEVPDEIVYWRWIGLDKLGVVGKKSVFHIDITKPDEPAIKIFDRDSKLEACQIMSYDVDAEGKWCNLIGLYSPDQRNINAWMQLYNIEKQQHQPIEGYAACFAELPLSDTNPSYKNSVFCFCEKKAAENIHRLHIMEIGQPAPGNGKFKVTVDIMMAQDAPGDFPILMQAAPKYGLIFMITKMGYLFLFESYKGSLIYRQRITDQLVFVAVRNMTTDGMICISKVGQVLAINVEDANLVKFVMNAQHIPDNKNIAFRMAQRYGLSGADEIFLAQFNTCFAQGDYAGAARAARDAPGTLLRNQDTINKFKSLPAPTAGPHPSLIYFSTLLETTKLNEIESLELVRPVLQQGKVALIEDWMAKDRITMSDALGDVIRQYNPTMALKVYQNAGAPDKVIMGLVETQQFDKIIPYCQQMNYKPDFMKILRAVVPLNSQAALSLAQMISVRDATGNPKTPLEGIVQVFLEFSKIQETTAFLLEALKGNLAHEGHLQTKLFQINLQSNPNVAEGIFQLNMLSHYDKDAVAKMCEQVGMYGRALQNYTRIEDAKRVMINTHAINQEIMLGFFARLSEEDSLTAMFDLMRSNPRANGPLVAEIAVKYSNKIDAKKSIQVLESFGTNDGLLHFLCNVLPHTEDPDIYFKYIECCARLNRFSDVEKVIKETSFYDPIKVRDFLMEGKFADPRPLIYLCDMHNFIEDLTKYLYQTKQQKCIEIYLFKVNSSASPKVLGTLLNIDCDENYIRQLLNSIRVTPIPELVEQFENRGKLRMLTSWLEQRYDERSQEPALHNALAKIYIDTGEKDPQEFLIKNQFYDSKIIGKYCEDRNPDLAFTAYKRAWGKCDDELIEVTNKAYLYRAQARYLVERQEPNLWAKVLDPSNPHRQNVIEQVVQTALPETKNVDEVSITVKAFIDAKLPEHLIELLERIVLHNSDFAENKSLQNLLILTAIRSYPTRVMDYINKLENYDGNQLAAIAKEEEHGLYQEALCIYKKFNQPVEAIKVILYNLNNIKQATEYAEKTNLPEVYSELGKAQLDHQNLQAALDAFIAANDPSMFERVILLNQSLLEKQDLVQYLLMARKTLKDRKVDNELIYAYAKGGEKYLSSLESFVSDPNQADMLACGERCFDERLFLASEILFKRIGNNQLLAKTYVMLRKFQLAYEAARKADIPKVWKAVCFACIRAKEFVMANKCGQHVIIHPDHLEDVIQFFEKFGYTDELIILLEQGMSLDRAHTGIYTDLGIVMAKYQPNRLGDHINSYAKKIQIPKLIRVCEQYQMWPEAVQLHVLYDQFDQAIITMMEHSPSSFRHDLFTQNIIKVANHDLFYKAFMFYLEEEPMLLNDLFKLLASKIDLTRAVQVMKNSRKIALIAPFLKNVQQLNISAVNEALNKIYLENEDFESLRASIKDFDSIDSIELAVDLEQHDLLECRRIAALLYRKNKRFQQSIAISKRDGFYQDAMEAVAESRDPALAEDLLRFVMAMQDKELIATMLYTCYELIKPDVAMEIGWRCGLQEFVMPYFIQFVRDLSTRVEKVQKSTEDIKKKEEVKAEEEANRPLDLDMHFMFPGMNPGMAALPAIMPAAGSMPGMGMGGPIGGMGMGAPIGGLGMGVGMPGAFATAPQGMGNLGNFGSMGGMPFGINQNRF